MNITERGFTLSTETDKGKNMANQISTESANAFMQGRNFKKAAMQVKVESEAHNLVHMYFHGNLIAKRFTQEGKTVTMVSNAGWFSNTTRERLNAIPGVKVNQKAFTWYLNGKEWDGGWTEV